MNGIAEARVQAHRLRHMVNRLISMCRDPRYGEILNQLVGDIAQASPHQLDMIETALDRASYAMSIMGEDFLKGRLPLEDLTEVQEATEGSRPFGTSRYRASLDPEKLARWFERRVRARQARRDSEAGSR